MEAGPGRGEVTCDQRSQPLLQGARQSGRPFGIVLKLGQWGQAFIPPNLQVLDVGYLGGGAATLEEASHQRRADQ